MNRMGRPRVYKQGVGHICVSYPNEMAGIWKELDKLGLNENRSRSELIILAVKDYLKIHSPGNPQPILEVCKTRKLMQDFLIKKAKARFKVLLEADFRGSGYDDILEKNLKFASQISDPPKELTELIEKATNRYPEGS